MPNTNPVNDNRQVTEFILKRALEVNTVRVYPVAAVSSGLKGKGLCEYGDLKDAGAVALSDDGNPVMDSQLMRRALEYAKGFGLPVISHCEDRDLAEGGVMNEGEIATRMGLAGIPNAAESVMVIREAGCTSPMSVPQNPFGPSEMPKKEGCWLPPKPHPIILPLQMRPSGLIIPMPK
jgi:dihydroorotase